MKGRGRVLTRPWIDSTRCSPSRRGRWSGRRGLRNSGQPSAAVGLGARPGGDRGDGRTRKTGEGDRRGGGSPITQQVAKEKNCFLWPARSVVRKGAGTALALWIGSLVAGQTAAVYWKSISNNRLKLRAVRGQLGDEGEGRYYGASAPWHRTLFPRMRRVGGDPAQIRFKAQAPANRAPEAAPRGTLSPPGAGIGAQRCWSENPPLRPISGLFFCRTRPLALRHPIPL